MKMLKHLLVVLSAASMVVARGSLAQSTNTEQRREDSSVQASGIFQAFVDTQSAITSYDIVYREKNFIEYADKSFAEERVDCTLQANLRTNQFRSVRRFYHTTLQTEDPARVGAERMYGFALVSDGKRVWYREFHEPEIRTREDDIRQHIGEMGVPEIRMIGFAKYPTPIFPESFYDSLLASRTTPSENWSCSTSSDGKLIVRSEFPVQSLRRHVVWDFDAKTYLPVSQIATVSKLDDSGVVSGISPSYKEQYDWVDQGGLSLISTVAGECYERRKVGEETSQLCRVQYDAKYVWNSVNEVLADTVFRRESILNVEELVREANGAAKRIDQMESAK